VLQGSSGEGDLDAPAAEDTATLALRAAAPDTVVDAVGQRIFEALLDDRTLGADTLCSLNPEPVTREEDVRRKVSALACSHPIRIHAHSFSKENRTTARM
jgi:hypothetical protein